MADKKQMETPLTPRISLEQWRCLVAVVEEGGYAQAAARLHKSQSSVSYSVQKLESVLDIKAFVIEGRRAVLTRAGEMLYRRARQLLEDAAGLEVAARKASAGWEAEIAIAVEVLFPTWLLLGCLDDFGRESPQTRVELYETVIGGAPEALEQGRVDLAITPHVPRGFVGEMLPRPAQVIPVAHPDHPLHQLGREVTLRDLRQHRHLVVRDTGSQRTSKTTTVEVTRRWTLTNMATSIGAACRGYGFAWLPKEKILAELESGLLKPLPIRGGSARSIPLYLIFADRDAPGPGALRLAEIIRAKLQEPGVGT
ncbi:LysR family transcriptional regulator [Microbulbifer thermotolerans]|uniref:LysR family transcriptional regulator n=1 Tax=Microbulbifer thermotolerans TaxID=252514 RepID=A0AB35HU85_MICTH|nr:LysR family transcriptional regulator [Microbulbifer thermotolerans]MCX2779712.1 LysR family transcriptional regulator [Microbulbifer thermotolerans]MCX2794945.1 LysR family transcriptional regulator [Microbulbifer thermotolerans]MCX2800509.1 LysR family transcriptional regulator [Microbulbifer thermotolerans]MCX2805117.1 LysR family transcriptional regulator [Microbulbifer thermotolerans]MCX2831133.1 LysR family transcriptional regulator [Microbulbifer thermotolerans]